MPTFAIRYQIGEQWFTAHVRAIDWADAERHATRLGGVVDGQLITGLVQ